MERNHQNMIIKVGILTYHRVHNYGAVLQAYALKTFLQANGHHVEFVDYWPTYFRREYSLLYYYSLKNRSIKGKIKRIFEIVIGLYRIVKRHNGFKQFIKKHLELSQKSIFDNSDKINKNYDIVIYGGDQIWRKQKYETFNGFDPVYFAENNISARHISYAASMGIIDINYEEKECLKSWMKNFDKIMVRENDLNELITSMNYNSNVVIDPVFLLDQTDWERLIPFKKHNSKYILFYHHNYCKDAELLVNKLKKYYRYKVKIIRPKVDSFRFGEQEQQTATPIEFLSLFKNAEFIVSTSYHGVAFSIIFRKQFFALGMGKNSGRVKTLLAKLKLDERYLETNRNVDFNQGIDYREVEEKLFEEINFSKHCLLESINIK